jgi:beta-N-acetylhexosaminidase
MRHTLALALAALAACAAPPRAPTPASSPALPAAPNPGWLGAELPAQDRRWVERTLASLPLRRKVAQMLMPRIDGQYLAAGSPAYEEMLRWVREEGVGSVTMGLGPPLEIATTLNRLQRASELPLLVSSNMETGGARFSGGIIFPYGIEVGGGTAFPPVMAVGATGEERLAYAMGRVTAREARALGIHMVFSPVVDVNNNPANPIINTRAYGGDPGLVGRLAAAHVRGVQDHGVLATAKHFPGHGDTGVDSHLSLPVITVDKARADSVELPPYRAVIDAGVAAVMSAHIAFPALTGDSLPATLSPRLMTGLLQEELGFEGLVVTDAMNMGGIVRQYGDDEAAVRAVQAGADILLFPVAVTPTIDAVVAAVERGEISEARIDRSVRRLLETKARLGLRQSRTVDVEAVPRVVGIPAHRAVAQEIADRSISVARDRGDLLPMGKGARVLSVVYADDNDPLAGKAFHQVLRERAASLETVALGGDARPEELSALRARAESADVVLFSPFVRVMAFKGDVAVAEPVAALVAELARTRPVIVTSFGNPYVIEQFPGVGSYVLAWGQDEAAQRAAARALTGEIAATGRMPITLPASPRR